MMKRVALLFLLSVVGAQRIPCNVTRVGGKTSYSVPDFKANDCEYDWSNSTHHVLANQEVPVDEKVANKSHRTLLLHVCSELMHYTRHCPSEGIKRMATCTTNCSGNAGLPEDGGNHSHYWSAFTVLLLLLVLLLLFLCYKFKHRVCRCLQKKKVYNVVPNLQKDVLPLQA